LCVQPSKQVKMMNSLELHIPSSNDDAAGCRLPPLKKRPISIRSEENLPLADFQETVKTPESEVALGEQTIRDILHIEYQKSVRKLLHASKSLTDLKNEDSKGKTRNGKRLIRDILQAECGGKSVGRLIHHSHSLAELKTDTAYPIPTINFASSIQNFAFDHGRTSSYLGPSVTLLPQLKKPCCASLPGADTILTLAAWNEQVELMIARHMQRRRNSMELWKQNFPVETDEQHFDV
jgi:hypothetical protein